MIDTKQLNKITKALEGVEGYVLSMDVGDNEVITITKNAEAEASCGKEPIGFRG